MLLLRDDLRAGLSPKPDPSRVVGVGVGQDDVLIGPELSAWSSFLCRTACLGDEVSTITLPALVTIMNVLPNPIAW